jgi:hypothetical protein
MPPGVPLLLWPECHLQGHAVATFFDQMKSRTRSRLDVPQEAFMAVLKLNQ